MRRIDRVLVRAEAAGSRAGVAGYGFVSALAGLSDHVPVVATIHSQHSH